MAIERRVLERQDAARRYVVADIRDACAQLADARKLLDETGLPERVLAPLDSALRRASDAAQDALRTAPPGADRPSEGGPVTAPDQAPDLRDRIAEALSRWTLKAAGGRVILPRHEAALRENSAARADAVMAEVQPVLDAKDAQIAEIRKAAQGIASRATHAEIEQRQRAEAAERDLADLRRTYGHLTEQHQQIGDLP